MFYVRRLWPYFSHKVIWFSSDVISFRVFPVTEETIFDDVTSILVIQNHQLDVSSLLKLYQITLFENKYDLFDFFRMWLSFT